MGSKNNDLGRAYEYACLCGLVEEVSKRRPVNLIKNDNYYIAERSWNSLTDAERLTYSASSHAAIMEILANMWSRPSNLTFKLWVCLLQ